MHLAKISKSLVNDKTRILTLEFDSHLLNGIYLV